MIKKIDFEEAKYLIDNQPDLLVIDVREESEYITGHVIGAELLAMSELSEERAAEVIPHKDTPILLYCRTGRRSRTAAKQLDAFGYTAIYNVGGLAGWPYKLEY